jgi:hypothetical protein
MSTNPTLFEFWNLRFLLCGCSTCKGQHRNCLWLRRFLQRNERPVINCYFNELVRRRIKYQLVHPTALFRIILHGRTLAMLQMPGHQAQDPLLCDPLTISVEQQPATVITQMDDSSALFDRRQEPRHKPRKSRLIRNIQFCIDMLEMRAHRIDRNA